MTVLLELLCACLVLSVYAYSYIGFKSSLELVYYCLILSNFK